MKRGNFWKGFALGAGAVVGGGLIAATLRRDGSRILRLEKSIQIAAPLVETFEAWGDFDQLSQMSPMITNVRTFGNRSRWKLRVHGVPVEWEAEITQVVPYQAIGWKSLAGPKHSGRITFSPIGNDTLVHVQMNYAPPLQLLRPLLSPFGGELEGYIEQALREFKAGMEGFFAARVEPDEDRLARSTGTHGPGVELLTETQSTRFGAPSTPVEYTKPPEVQS
jgi:uncharacterized membrane protein